MTANETKALVGQSLLIRGITHLVLAAGEDTLLLLQLAGDDDGKLFNKGEPVQYIVARYPEWYGGTLIWGQGKYFPLLQYSHAGNEVCSSALALRDAAEWMTEGMEPVKNTEGGRSHEDTRSVGK